MRSGIKAGVLAGDLGLFGATAAFGQATPTATYTLDPDSGPVGTPIAVTGTTTCPDNPDGPDIELFFLFGNFSGGDDINPGEVFEMDGGAFAGTLVVPDPDDPRFVDNSGSTPLDNAPDGVFSVEARCTDASGQGNSGGIIDQAPTFTITQAPDDGGGDSAPLLEAEPATPQEAQPTFTG
jgi:hypothetical protein